MLAQLVAAARAEGAGEGDVLITATQADLAQLAGSSRESASRFLAVLERAGIITQGRGKLTVHDPGRAGAVCLLTRRLERRVLGRRGGACAATRWSVIVPVKRAADGSRVLGLPKGHPDGDETPEQAATPRGARGDRRRRPS